MTEYQRQLKVYKRALTSTANSNLIDEKINNFQNRFGRRDNVMMFNVFTGGSFKTLYKSGSKYTTSLEKYLSKLEKDITSIKNPNLEKLAKSQLEVYRDYRDNPNISNSNRHLTLYSNTRETMGNIEISDGQLVDFAKSIYTEQDLIVAIREIFDKYRQKEVAFNIDVGIEYAIQDRDGVRRIRSVDAYEGKNRASFKRINEHSLLGPYLLKAQEKFLDKDTGSVTTASGWKWVGYTKIYVFYVPNPDNIRMF